MKLLREACELSKRISGALPLPHFLLWVYLHSTPVVLIFYFGFIHAILQVYSHLTSSLLALYSGFNHTVFWVASHFTPVCSYFSLGALKCTPCVPTPYSSFYWHLTPGSHLIYSGFTHTCLQFYSHFTHDFTCNLLQVLFTVYWRFTHTLLLASSHFAPGFAHTSHQVYTYFTLGLLLCWRWRGQLSLAECWLSDNEALERRQKLWINRGVLYLAIRLVLCWFWRLVMEFDCFLANGLLVEMYWICVCQRFKGWSGPVPWLVGRRDFAKSAPPGRETGDPKIIKNSRNDLRRNKLIY